MNNDNVTPINRDELMLARIMNDDEFITAIEDLRKLWIKRNYPRQAIIRGVNIDCGTLVQSVRANIFEMMRELLTRMEETK